MGPLVGAVDGVDLDLERLGVELGVGGDFREGDASAAGPWSDGGSVGLWVRIW